MMFSFQFSGCSFQASNAEVALRLRWLVLLAGLLGSWPALAQEAESQPVQDAGESLQKSGFPWYSRQGDAPRPLHVQPPQDETANRASSWQRNPSFPMPNLGIWTTILQVLGILALIAVIVLIVVLLTRQFMSSEVAETAGSRLVETSRDVDRVDHLPFHLRQPTGDFLSEARRLYE